MNDQYAKERSEEEYEAAIQQARTQADMYRDRVLVHDQRMELAMEMLSQGWHGRDAVLVKLEDIHQTLRNRYLMQATMLDAKSEDLQKQYRRFQEDSDQTSEEERWN